MKNHALRWGLVVSLLLTMFTISAGAAATDTMPTAPTCAHYSDEVGVHEGWTSLPNNGSLTGNYFVPNDFAVHSTANYANAGGPLYIKGNVVICLNGKELSYANGALHLFNMEAGSTLTICDCSAEKTGHITRTAGNADKAIFMMRAGCVVNVFDADFVDCVGDQIIRCHVTGGTANFKDVAVTGLSDSIATNAPFEMKAGYNLNLYNCQITDPTFSVASSVKGVISVQAGTTVNMENTTISGATNTSSTMEAAVYLNGSGAKLNMFDGCYIKDNVDGASCGGVYVTGGAIFEMHGGTISGNKCTAHGAGVRLANGTGTFNMYGGTIENNESVNNAGGVMVAGTFNMYGGTIKGNTAKGASFGGGGVAVSSGTFTMEDGTIEANQATNASGQGGGVRVYGTGSFTMKDGEIKNNTSVQMGGGVYVDAATTFTMNGGEITDNTGVQGGGVCLKGTVTVAGGTISGNTGSSWMGHDVCLWTAGNFTMNSGTIGTAGKQSTITLRTGAADGSVTMTINGGNVDGYFTLSGDGAENVVLGSDFANTLEFKPWETRYLVAAKTIGTNMNLGESLNVNFNFNKGGAVPATAVATIGDREVTANVTTKTLDGVEAYVITVPGVAATEMSETISLLVKDANGNTINMAEDSIKAYGERVLAYETMEDAHTVIVDMLNYGAAAQKYFGVEVTMQTLANAGIADYQTKATNIGDALAAAQADSSISFAGSRAYSYANLTLDDMVDFNLYFWVDQIGEENKKYTYSINGGEAKEGTFSEYLDADQENPVLYTLKVEDLTIADLADAKVTVTFYEKGQEKTITDSVYNYLARTDAKSKFAFDGEDTSGLSQYLVAFATSAKEYAGDPDLGANETPIG